MNKLINSHTEIFYFEHKDTKKKAENFITAKETRALTLASPFCYRLHNAHGPH